MYAGSVEFGNKALLLLGKWFWAHFTLNVSLNVCRRNLQATCFSPLSYALYAYFAFSERNPDSMSNTPRTPFSTCTLRAYSMPHLILSLSPNKKVILAINPTQNGFSRYILCTSVVLFRKQSFLKIQYDNTNTAIKLKTLVTTMTFLPRCSNSTFSRRKWQLQKRTLMSRKFQSGHSDRQCFIFSDKMRS